MLTKQKKYTSKTGYSWNGGERYGSFHVLLGPCPVCGEPCFDYGGGWRCAAMHCCNSPENLSPSLGNRPEWWSENICIYPDGNAFCAVFCDFINLQESIAGFGDSPKEAVDNLLIERK